MKYFLIALFALFLIVIIIIAYFLVKYLSNVFFTIPPLQKEDSPYQPVIKLISLVPNDLNGQLKKFLYFQYKYNLPLITMFAKYLNCLNYQYCFVSRDCYFLYKLYNKLYPNNSSVYFYSSRKAFEKASPNFVNYTKYYVRRGYVWIDLGGINQTYYTFMKKHIGFVPFKILLSVYWIVNEFQENLTYLYKNNSSNIELFNRAPTPKILDVSSSHTPIYANNLQDDRIDFYNDICIQSYQIILNNLNITELNSIKYDKKYMKYLLENISKF